MSICVGVGDKARSVKQMYIGVDGKARRVVKAYIGVNNKAQLMYSSWLMTIKDIPTTEGQTCNWAGYNWTVVHVTTDLIYMILTNIHKLMAFGNATQYATSNLAAECTKFLETMDAQYRAALADVTVNGVTAKVFVPAHGMLCPNSPTSYQGSGGTNNYKASNASSYGDYDSGYPIFSWFNFPRSTRTENRVGRYNGSTQNWWTSTAAHSAKVWGVGTDGATSTILSPTTVQNGFRPCIAVKRK